MSLGDLVIFDIEGDRRCAGNCWRIDSLVRGILPESLTVSKLARVPDHQGGRDPYAAIVRMPSRRPVAEVLELLRWAWPSTSLLGAICGVTPDVGQILALLRNGLDDFLRCPFSEIDLVVRLRRLLPETVALRSERAALVRDLQIDTLVGESRAFLDAARRIPLVARSNATIIIGGETGSGKGLFARAIHYNGPRKTRPFIPVNCSALPDHLFENELFGHAKGAYTDAATAEKGLVAEAEGGTIFLDEVDALASASQAKLLRFLEDREYRPLGSTRTLVADVRVIAATNANLEGMVAGRRLREDLYHRLNVLSLTVPPLRERLSDIPLLAHHILARCAAEYGRRALRLSSAALRKMLAYSWPGNVRELEALLHRAVVFGARDVLDADDIEVPGPKCDTPVPVAPLRGAREKALAEFERSYLIQLLAEHGGNVSHAARSAESDRRTFQRMLRKYGIDRSALLGSVPSHTRLVSADHPGR